MGRKEEIEVVYFQRKPRANSNFSLESYFDTVRANFPDFIKCRKHVASHLSNGVIKRLKIALDVYRNQGQINHITGDINYANLFLNKRNTVLTILDCGFLENKSALQHFILKLFWLKIPIRKSTLVTVISEATKIEILKNVKCDPNKIRVIYVPVSEMFVRDTTKEFNASNPTILQVGTKMNKNLSRLIQALEGIPCVLDIVGELTEEYLSLLKKHKINYKNSVRISNEELLDKYKNCDMLSFVSTYEGFGMPIVEANIVGKPVVTGNILSMPEIAGDAACLVDPFNVSEIREGILKVIEDETYRNKLIENGFINKERFKIQHIVKQYIEFYQEVLEANN